MIKITPEDRALIQELTHRYSFFVDTKRIDELMDLFTEDGLFDESSLGVPSVKGRSNMRPFWEQGVSGFHMAHYVTNHMIDSFEGDRATGKCFVHSAARRMADNAPLHFYGYYTDEYARQDGRWKFRSRVVTPLLPLEFDLPPID